MAPNNMYRWIALLIVKIYICMKCFKTRSNSVKYLLRVVIATRKLTEFFFFSLQLI